MSNDWWAFFFLYFVNSTRLSLPRCHLIKRMNWLTKNRYVRYTRYALCNILIETNYAYDRFSMRWAVIFYFFFCLLVSVLCVFTFFIKKSWLKIFTRFFGLPMKICNKNVLYLVRNSNFRNSNQIRIFDKIKRKCDISNIWLYYQFSKNTRHA